MTHNTYIDDKVKEQVNNIGMMLLKRKLYMVALLELPIKLMVIMGCVHAIFSFTPLNEIGRTPTSCYFSVIMLLLSLFFIYNFIRHMTLSYRLVKNSLENIEFAFITDEKIIDVDHENYDKVLSLSAFEVYRVWKKIKEDDQSEDEDDEEDDVHPVEVKLNYNH